jgi:hypothetical protein
MESELVYNREIARNNKDFELSDKIRNELDLKGVIIIDTNKGQEVYFTINKTREQVIEKIQADARGESIFDAWLYSQLN